MNKPEPSEVFSYIMIAVALLYFATRFVAVYMNNIYGG